MLLVLTVTLPRKLVEASNAGGRVMDTLRASARQFADQTGQRPTTVLIGSLLHAHLCRELQASGIMGDGVEVDQVWTFDGMRVVQDEACDVDDRLTFGAIDA